MNWIKNHKYTKDINSIQNEYNCTITIVDDLVHKGRGSYDYIPVLVIKTYG